MAIKLRVAGAEPVRLGANENEALRLGTGEGEQGTRNYDELYNKPQINGVTLEGDKNPAELGVQGTDKLVQTVSASSAADEYPSARALWNQAAKYAKCKRFVGSSVPGGVFMLSSNNIADIYNAQTSGGQIVFIFDEAQKITYRVNYCFIDRTDPAHERIVVYAVADHVDTTQGPNYGISGEYQDALYIKAAATSQMLIPITRELANASDIPTRVSQLTNDAGYVNAAGAKAAAPVQSVNGRTGAVSGLQEAALVGTTATVTYQDMVAAITAGRAIQISHTDNTYGVFTFVDGWVYSPVLGVIGGNGIFNFDGGLLLGQLICTSDGWAFLATNLAKSDDISELWTAVSGKIGGGDVPTYEQDPTVPAWAKSANKPSYTAAEVGALPDTTVIPTAVSDLTNDSGFVNATEAASAAPVQSVNGQTGNVTGLQPAGNYAAAKAGDTTAAALATASIPFAKVDSTSTSTVFTATVPGITEYRDGVSFWLRNGVITSASGFTVNINGLGAKKVFNNMAPTTRDTTMFNVSYTMLFVYCEWLDDGAGGFLQYRGYDANTNTIGYQIRTNSSRLPMKSVTYRYRLFFTAADGKHFVPANNSTSTNATSTRTVCQDPIDPHGPIFYYGTTASVAAGAKPSAGYLWQQYTLSLGYSFNRTGAALVLDVDEPLYIKAAPQADGSAIIDATTPYVQTLPTTADGFIYIFLGYAYNTTQIELQMTHPVYHFYNGAIRLWTGPV